MYNKLFTKILDSSIWLESSPTRIVWVTFLAMMDQDGMVALSSIGNVANRARVTEEEAEDAIRCLEAADMRNPDQDNDGRRIERIPGAGWFVINSEKYRDIIKAETMRAQTRERVRKHRRNAHVTQCNENVTPSDSDSEANSDSDTQPAMAISDNQFLAIYFETFPGQGLSIHQQEEIADRVDDEVLWRQALKFWKGNNYVAKNTFNICNYYDELKDGKNGNKTRSSRADNGKSEQTTEDYLRSIGANPA